MTNESGIGGTALVNQSPSDMKHSLRSATKAKADRLEEEVLVQEEEKLMDEEITSEEEEEDQVVTERTMLTVALVKSVVETRNNVEESPGGASPDSPGSHRYALRKRRRPSGMDLERLEHFQSSKAGGLARIVHKVSDPEPDGQPSSTMPPPVAVEPPRRPKTEKIPSARSLGRGANATVVPRAAPRVAPPEPQSILSSSSFVPNPLLQPLQPVMPRLTAEPHPFVAVPCPLMPVVTATVEPTEKRKVTINDSGAKRNRGMSIDMDLGLDFPVSDDHSAIVPASRDRAFSFECFAFGINADEPLPPLEQDPGINFTGRPRGDSIIFDPVSFQDGGIHEQNALETHRNTTLNAAVSSTTTTTTKTKPDPALAVAPRADPATRSMPASNVSASTATISTAVSSTVSSSASFSMDLLNKDGRIGIYLPEARRARIARFHSKRSRRIWRKRIKYDCRKKLADSRPRIKGRFVKRADNE